MLVHIYAHQPCAKPFIIEITTDHFEIICRYTKKIITRYLIEKNWSYTRWSRHGIKAALTLHGLTLHEPRQSIDVTHHFYLGIGHF